MPIRPFLANQPFDPETIEEMSRALEAVCDTLSLRLVDDAATRLVAQKIIELVQRGVRGAERLRLMTLKEFKHEGKLPRATGAQPPLKRGLPPPETQDFRPHPRLQKSRVNAQALAMTLTSMVKALGNLGPPRAAEAHRHHGFAP